MSPQQRAEETRTRILEAAEECFARHGYEATSVAHICECAGVTKGAFYHHFPTKHAVFMALLDRWLSGLDTQLSAARSGASSVPAAFEQMGRLAGLIFDAAGGHLPMFLDFWSSAIRDSETWQVTVAPYRRYQTFFADLVKAGIEEGTLIPADPDTVSRLVMAVAVGVILQELLDPGGADWGATMQEGLRVVLKGLQR
jgi:AcrR family transcriptional regulator